MDHQVRHIREKLTPRKKKSIFYKDNSPRTGRTLCDGDITSWDFLYVFHKDDRHLICPECLKIKDERERPNG